jgi:thiol-disulfide isomerase/thioredoxin
VTLPEPRALLLKAGRALAYLAGFFLFAAAVNWYQAPATQAIAPLPQLELATLAGQKTTIATAGSKKTVIYFFAPWCAVCKVSMDALNFFDDSNRVQAIAVGLDYENVEELKPYQTKVNVPVYAGSHELQRRFMVDRYPTVYILNNDGSVAHVMVGYTSRFGIWIRTLL